MPVSKIISFMRRNLNDNVGNALNISVSQATSMVSKQHHQIRFRCLCLVNSHGHASRNDNAVDSVRIDIRLEHA